MTVEVELAEAIATKRELQATLKALEEEITERERVILAQWQVDGIESQKVATSKGTFLLYLSTRTYCKSEFLDLAKLQDEWPALMTINHSKAGSLLAEFMASGNEGALAQLASAGIYPNEVTKINCKKG